MPSKHRSGVAGAGDDDPGSHTRHDEPRSDALNDLILAIKAAKDGGMSDAQLDAARKLQRRAQFRVDFINAENSMGFHADQEAAKTLAEAIDYARQGQLELLKSTTP